VSIDIPDTAEDRQQATSAHPLRLQATSRTSIEGPVSDRPTQGFSAALTLGELVHELRTPLQAARMALELGEQLPGSDRVLHSALTHMHELLEIATGAPQSAVNTSLRVALMEAVLLADRDARVEVVDSLVKDVVLQVAPATVRQLVVILVTNALKFSPEHARVRVEVALREEIVVVSVHDRGAGVVDEEIDRIFESGVRGRSAGVVEGSGIGLAIARRMALALGGSIELGHTGEAGSRFDLFLPASAGVVAFPNS
jgi:signal transduction histidine kinase